MSEKLAALSDRSIDVGYQFEVRVADDGEVGNFQAVEGLTRTTDVYEYVEGGRNQNVHQLPGQTKLGEITLKWGWMSLSWLYDWSQKVEIGSSFRKDLIITQLDRQGRPLRVYTISGAWPTSWTGAALDASGSQVPVEEIKLRFNKLKLDVKTPGRGARGAGR